MSRQGEYRPLAIIISRRCSATLIFMFAAVNSSTSMNYPLLCSCSGSIIRDVSSDSCTATPLDTLRKAVNTSSIYFVAMLFDNSSKVIPVPRAIRRSHKLLLSLLTHRFFLLFRLYHLRPHPFQLSWLFFSVICSSVFYSSASLFNTLYSFMVLIYWFLLSFTFCSVFPTLLPFAFKD